MNTSARIRKKATAPAAAKQAPTPPKSATVENGRTRVCNPSDVARDWHLLLIGNTEREPVSGLWGARDGGLFLWEQPDGEHAPRAVGVAEALSWVRANFGETEPPWFAPSFPENSPAAEFICQACEPTRSASADAAGAARLRAVHLEDDLTNAVDQAQAFAELLEHRVLNPGDGGRYNDAIQNGITLLGIVTNKRLRSAVAAAFESLDAAKGGAR